MLGRRQQQRAVVARALESIQSGLLEEVASQPGTDGIQALLDRVRRADGVETACPAFSFGVAQCPHEATEFDELVQLADTRLYEAKEAKR